MQLDAASSAIFRRLEQELPGMYTYHNIQHTTSVYKAARELGIAEGIQGDDLTILLTAAAYHDTGILKTYQNHEEASCIIARESLPRFGYTEEQVDKVCQLIMSTRMPQEPQTLTERVICDADLYYLGTDNYNAVAETLYHELQLTGMQKNRKEWHDEQAAFLGRHMYFTAAARERLDEKKRYNLATVKKEAPQNVHELKHDGFKAGDILLIIFGVITAAFALQGFLVPNNFFDGGITGISLLIHELTGFNLALVIVIANLPLIIMSRFTITLHFAIKTFCCILLLGVCLYVGMNINYPVITQDKLLVSIFGGFFLGVGIGLTMRAGCAVDGIEVLALYTWRKTSFTISEIIMALNIIIFSVAAFKFGIPTALYSILTYFTASKTVDYVVEGIEAYTGVTIISGKSEIIKDRLVNELGRGITVYKGERGYLPGKFEVHEDCDIIFTVITRLELRKLKNLVNEVDHKAFVFASTIRETSGGVIKRRHMH
jgi:uncharacterized membrane-anchored protein YitT (DUF2179 family)/predicted metal-dependent HD superfamily phosphohydrolase